MNHALKRRDGEFAARTGDTNRASGCSIELQIGQEVIEVWLDETGIHFSQAGAANPGGTLPWGEAIAMSLIPPHLPRMATVKAV